MKRVLILLVFIFLILLSLRPVVVENYQPILLPSYNLEENQEIVLGKNKPTENREKNLKLEKLFFMEDFFSDRYGFRPYPWGQEIFGGNPEFLCDGSMSKVGERSFQIKGKSLEDVGVLAVPGFYDKPLVEEGEIYYLEFSINYKVEKGEGIRIFHQFFIEGDYLYPTYACYGPFITGSSEGKWERVGLLVKAPPGAMRGDPVILLSGKGTVNIDQPFFGRVEIVEKGGD